MQRIKKVLTLSIVAFAALSLSSCDGFFSALGDALMSVDGSVVNARAAGASTEWYKGSGTETLVGATVTLTNVKTSTQKYTGTVSSNGTYSISGVEPGRYKLEGTKSGWQFVPKVVDVSGFSNTLPNLLAYISPGTEPILIIMEWENRTIDVDMHLVIDNQDSDALDPTLGAVSDPLYTVKWNTSTYLTNKVVLERDVRLESYPGQVKTGIPTVETILINANPFTDDSTGWLRLYLGAFYTGSTPTGELTGYSAEAVKEARAQVHVMQGSDWLGTFRLPSETFETMIGVLKIEVKPVSGDPSRTLYSVMSFGNFGNQARSFD